MPLKTHSSSHIGAAREVTKAMLIVAAGPFRARGLARKYARFREEHKAEHDAIDSKFNHCDAIVNGIRWHYIDEGPHDGDVVLFLHGLPESWYSWRYVLPLIDPRYRLIAIDMKGYGRSDKDDGDYNWHTVASQTLGLIDHLGIKKFYVVGHDWGALIGSILVGDHPERIHGFVRMEADLLPPRSKLQAYLQKPQWLLFQIGGVGTAMMQDAEQFVDFVYCPRMTTSLRPEDRDYFIYELSRLGVARCLPRYFYGKNWDLAAATVGICRSRFPFPVLVLQADSDNSQPASAFTTVVKDCPNVELKWVKNAGHFSNLDQPGQVAMVINEFLQRDKR
jgi:epoxide hydrolase 4